MKRIITALLLLHDDGSMGHSARASLISHFSRAILHAILAAAAAADALFGLLFSLVSISWNLFTEAQSPRDESKCTENLFLLYLRIFLNYNILKKNLIRLLSIFYITIDGD